ncbi:uncharacterized protein BCR38DRAFT_330319 [Pseudomassariella vexata]|uniref:Uncharacterized protein n=1 Tax=Pseudomassariella vexata TaxID=1141098 RepID=A0A1Y2EK16_9PEZI|nr:uncharacterized protein BCR38DRAFT_330319 [Pseudomassariella vexata]ORY71902.1 hypothetical protein BCR38DRAFT_330319 [Pseudomassariella vexata]
MQSYRYDTAPTSAKGKEPAIPGGSASTQPLPFSRKTKNRRPPLSQNTFSRPISDLTTSQTAGVLDDQVRNVFRSSNTWTSSSGDIGLASEGEEVDDREQFVDEYNRLAKKVEFLGALVYFHVCLADRERSMAYVQLCPETSPRSQ